MIVLCCVPFLSSCNDVRVEPVQDESQLLQRLLAVLNEDNSEFPAPDSVQFPDDLDTHPDSRMESYLLQTVFSLENEPDQQQSDVKTGITVQIDRVTLTANVDDRAVDSAWRFSDIMRSKVVVDTPGLNPEKNLVGSQEVSHAHLLSRLSATQQRQSVQRVALNLAGVTTNSVWIGDERLNLSYSDDSSRDCRRVYRWEAALSAFERIVLDVPFDACPEARMFGEFATWQQVSSSLTGVIIGTNADSRDIVTPINGVAWVSQTWGNLPVAGGAVVIDSLRIRLDDSRWLNVSRTKRRSGRGPETVAADIHREGSAPQRISLSWEDSGERVISDSGISYPARITLSSREHNLTLVVTAMHRLSESSAFAEKRLEIPVTLNGSHSGVGFLSFIAVAQ